MATCAQHVRPVHSAAPAHATLLILIDCNMADVVHPAKLHTFIVYIAPVITSLTEVLHDDEQEKLYSKLTNLLASTVVTILIIGLLLVVIQE